MINADSSDANSSDEDSDNGDFEIIQECSKTPQIEKAELHEFIVKIRKVIIIFLLSPTKMDDVFTKYCKEKFQKEFMLILNVKTRRNALLDMLERFALLQNCVRNSLVDINSDIIFNKSELKLLFEKITGLQLIKVAVKSLFQRDATLYTAVYLYLFILRPLYIFNVFTE